MPKGLPVHGYAPEQSLAKVAFVNENKITEENLLRRLDRMADDAEFDSRWTAIARTHMELAFMAMNRAVFKPQRFELDEEN